MRNSNHRLHVGLSATVAALTLGMCLTGCNKSQDATNGDSSGASGTAAKPATASPIPADVQSQIKAQQQASSAERAAHAPPAPK